MSITRAVVLCALSSVAAIAAANDAMVLAPGKSVSVVDAEDPAIQVVVTAPADQPLDLRALLSSAGPKESVYSIATRMQVNEARALVQASDGSISLGGAPTSVLPAPNITGGLVVFHRGRYAHYHAAPLPAVQVAGRPGEQLIRAKDEIPVPGRIAGAAPVPAALPAGPIGLPSPLALPSPVVLPTAITFPAGTGTMTIVPNTSGALTTSNSFSIGAGNVANFTQPSASSITLNAATGGQVQFTGAITTTGGTTPGGSITIR
jgi:hypothetical protein